MGDKSKNKKIKKIIRDYMSYVQNVVSLRWVMATFISDARLTFNSLLGLEKTQTVGLSIHTNPFNS